MPAAFGYGTNIHNILNIIHKKYIEERKVPNEKQIETLFDRMFKLRYATDRISNSMIKAGENIVKNYVAIHSDQFRRILQTEKNFEFVLKEAIISGQIDLLKKVDDSGNLAEVEIIDFKTEKDRDDKIYKLDYEKQLRFYAIACMKSLGLNPKKACIHHLDGTKNEKEYVDISAENLEKTKTEIQNDVEKILAKKYPAKPSRKNCENCDYRRICVNKGFCIGVKN